MALLSLEEAINNSEESVNSLYERHINKWLLKVYKMLGLNHMDIESAKGAEIYLRDGSVILDFTSAVGIIGLGHNHPRIIAAEKTCHDLNLIDALKHAPHKLQVALAYNLAQVLPDPLTISFFSVSGAEAVESALKLCERAQGKNKNKFITTTNSYHGKTRGALSVTKSGDFSDGFLIGLPERNIIEVPYGNINALENIINDKGSRKDVVAMIIEPIQGQGIHVPPPGYLSEATELCRKNNILVIFDEVKVGMCRTGTFWAFEAEDVVPDVVTISKALGGGKRAISAMVTSESVFKRAYGSIKNCALHTTTFGGLGESCAVAIETLNVMINENFAKKSKEKGAYLKKKLESIQEKYPSQVVEIRGRGLLLGVRLDFNKSKINKIIDTSKIELFKKMDSLFIASISREFYERYNIITHFSSTDPDILHIMPPLVVEKSQLDTFTEALEDILKRGLLNILAEFVKKNLVS